MANNISINRVTNANVYIDGVSQLGKAEEVNLPTITNKLSEHKALGMIGSLEYASGVDKLAMSIKWNSLYADVIQNTGNPYRAVKLQIRSSIERYEGGDRVEQVPVIIYVTGQFKDLPLGNFKAQDNVELTSNLTVTYAKLEIGGVEQFEIDLEAQIYRVFGQDLLAQYRENLGI